MQTLLLFDIDGTILWGGQAAKEAFTVALTEVYGTTGPIHDHDFSGKTDPQIVRELLTLAGLNDRTIDDGFDRFCELYLDGFEERVVDIPPKVLPGAAELVRSMEERDGIALGLVTGNLARAATIKLGAIGLNDPFAVGGYGSDHEIRNHLPGIAMERARMEWGFDFPADSVWVIGDTPRDVACGKYHGTRTLAVATGYYDVGVLRETGADLVVGDFSDHERVANLILSAS